MSDKWVCVSKLKKNSIIKAEAIVHRLVRFSFPPSWRCIFVDSWSLIVYQWPPGNGAGKRVVLTFISLCRRVLNYLRTDLASMATPSLVGEMEPLSRKVSCLMSIFLFSQIYTDEYSWTFSSKGRWLEHC